MRYLTADETRRCAAVGCSKFFKPHPRMRRQKYCSPLCQSRQYRRDTEGYAPLFKRDYECPQGHERTPDNTYVDPRGWKHCKVCRAEAARRWRQSHREHVRARNRRQHAANREQYNLNRKIRKALTGK